MDMVDECQVDYSNAKDTGNNFSIHVNLLLVWLLSLVFCWKIFPSIFSKQSNPASSPKGKSDLSASKRETSSSVGHLNLSHPSLSNIITNSRRDDRSILSRSEDGNSDASVVSLSDKKFLSQLKLEVCAKAKEAGKHPSYVPLVLNLVHHYNLDINKPVLANSYSIFHCCCLSGSLELVSSLSNMADIQHTTDHGDTPLYIAVYAAAHKKLGQPGLEVVQHLLQAGSDVNTANLAGFTALHQASRLSCADIVRLLLDWGANPQVGTNSPNESILSRSRSVMTRSMSVAKRKVANESFRVPGKSTTSRRKQ